MKAKESPENQTFVENFKSLFSKAVTRESDPSKVIIRQIKLAIYFY